MKRKSKARSLMKKKVVAIVQARMGSVRFPGKVMQSLAGKTLIEVLISRLKKAKRIDQIVVATTTENSDDPLATLLESKKISVVRGDRDDVLGRYVKAAKKTKAGVVVRITGDCPLIDPDLVQQAISIFQANEVDYLANCHIRSYPDGMDIQVFTVRCLQESSKQTHDKLDREHVTLHIRSNPLKFRQLHLIAPPSLYWPELGLTLDEKQDYELIKIIFEHFRGCINFSCFQILDFLKNFPHLLELNKSVTIKGNS